MSANAYAEEAASNKITLREALALATRENVDLKSTKLDIDIAKNNLKISKKFNNPDVVIGFNTGKAGRGQPQSVGVSQLVEIGKRDVRKKLGQENLILAQESYKLDEFYLKMDVRKAYIELVAAKSTYKVIEHQRKLLEELLAIARKKAKAGKAPQIDVLQVEIALNHLVPEENTARTNVQSAKYNFNKTLNLREPNLIFDSYDELLEENENFIDLMAPQPKDKLPQYKSISDLTSSKRFDLKVAKQEVEIAKKELQLVSRQRVPDIQIASGYLYSPQCHSSEGIYEAGAYIGGSLVNIPVFYNYSPEIKNAKLKLEQTKLNYESIENIVENDLKSVYEKFTTAKLNLNYYNQTMLKQSEDFINIAKTKYEKGESDIITLIVMEKSYQNIRTGYVQALADYYTSWIDFLKEVNDEDFTLIKTESI